MNTSNLKIGQVVYISKNADLIDDFLHLKGKKATIIAKNNDAVFVSIDSSTGIWLYSNEYEVLDPKSSDF